MKTVDSEAKILWNYLKIDDKLEKADCILALGSRDLRIAERGAELFLAGWAPLLIFSGGIGRLTPPEWNKSEAEMYADIALKMGVPRDKILLENQSTNTGENILFSKALLEEKGINVQKIILVHKPYMERRAYATLMKQWPGKEVFCTSPQSDYDTYPNTDVPREEMVNIMVGDFQRIKEYPAKGFQIPQEIPAEVEVAFKSLVEAGFTKYLI